MSDQSESEGDVVGSAVEPGSDAMHRAIVQTTVNPYLVLDSRGKVTWCSERIEILLGAPASTFVGRHFLELVEESSHEAVIAEYREFTAEDEHRPWIGPPMLLDLVHSDGRLITCEISAATGTSHGIDGVIVQVRRWRGTVLLYAAVDALAAGEPLEEVLAKLGAIVEHDMPGSAVFVAAGWDGSRFDVVAAATGATERRELAAHIEAPAREDWLATDGEAFADSELAELGGFASCWTVPVTVRGDDRPVAALVVLRTETSELRAHNTTVERVATLVALAIESDRNRRAWRRSAVTDRLTDLPNRSGLEEWLRNRAVDRPEDPLALLFCDVDAFKQVNDELGHAMGDRTLQVVAERLRRSVRDGDLVCRWGGDEFVVICTDPTAAEDLARRLIDHVQAPIKLEQHTAHVGLSVGIAFGLGRSPLDVLLRDSDHALLLAKGAGRNRYVVRP